MKDIYINPNGVTLSKPLADILHIKPGDILTIEVHEGRRPILEAPVVGITSTLLGSPAYMEIGALDRALKEPGRVSGAFLKIDPSQSAALYSALKDMPSVAGVSLKSEARIAFQKMIDQSAGAIRYIMTIIAGVITFGVIYNSARIAFAERQRDLASLRVIGFKRAEAALQVAHGDVERANADKSLADNNLVRAKALRRNGTISQASLDSAEQAARAANATLNIAKATISMREADLTNARASLITFTNGVAKKGSSEANDADNGDTIAITAPVSGRILRVIQKSETSLTAGSPIIEIGNVSNDLEVVAELLSTDAVQVSSGDRVIIDNWGGPYPLNGVVDRVEPWGFTKYSALGVEEQRVNVIIKFVDPLEKRQSLGHGYRMETRIVIWELKKTLTIPASALFRLKDGWAAFRVEGSRARLTPVEIGQNNGMKAQVLSGLNPGDKLVLYPGASLSDGTRVTQREIE